VNYKQQIAFASHWLLTLVMKFSSAIEEYPAEAICVPVCRPSVVH